MPEIPRLNGVIKALEQGKTAFVGFASPDIETATALASSPFDGVAFEMEHAPMSPPVLRDAHFTAVLSEMNGERHALTRSLLGVGPADGEPAGAEPIDHPASAGRPAPIRYRRLR